VSASRLIHSDEQLRNMGVVDSDVRVPRDTAIVFGNVLEKKFGHQGDAGHLKAGGNCSGETEVRRLRSASLLSRS
jgi:hypothetical protein